MKAIALETSTAETEEGAQFSVSLAEPGQRAWWVVNQTSEGARLKTVRELEKLLVVDVVASGHLLEAPSAIKVWNAQAGGDLVGSMIVEMFDRRPLRHLALSGPYFESAEGARAYAIGISAFVTPAWRGHGVGAALFAELERLGRPVFISFVNDSLRAHFDSSRLA